MDEYNSHNIYPNLSANTSNDQQFRLNKIDEIKDYFIAEIKKREIMCKNHSKYIASFEYFDKSLIVLSVAAVSISVASIATLVRTPVGIMVASCGFAFSITTGFVRKFLKTIRNTKKNTIKLLSWLAVNEIA